MNVTIPYDELWKEVWKVGEMKIRGLYLNKN